jgi:type VI secretion system protein ImpM
VVGFYGKLPSTGDFVARGLPDAFRRHWDAWITRTVAPLQREGMAFPPGGLRFRLVSGGRIAAGLILPSEDCVGRQFPLSLLLVSESGLTRKQIDQWCTFALGLLAPGSPPPDPDDLWQSLEDLPAPKPEGPVTGSFDLWTDGHPERDTAQGDAMEIIRQLFRPADP